MRWRWPWQREKRPTTLSPPAVVAPAPSGWAFLPPLQRSVADAGPGNLSDTFVSTLPTRVDPSFLGVMEHLVSDDAPGGIVELDPPGRGSPSMRAAGDDLALRPAISQRSTPRSTWGGPSAFQDGPTAGLAVERALPDALPSGRPTARVARGTPPVVEIPAPSTGTPPVVQRSAVTDAPTASLSPQPAAVPGSSAGPGLAETVDTVDTDTVDTDDTESSVLATTPESDQEPSLEHAAAGLVMTGMTLDKSRMGADGANPSAPDHRGGSQQDRIGTPQHEALPLQRSVRASAGGQPELLGLGAPIARPDAAAALSMATPGVPTPNAPPFDAPVRSTPTAVTSTPGLPESVDVDTAPVSQASIGPAPHTADSAPSLGTPPLDPMESVSRVVPTLADSLIDPTTPVSSRSSANPALPTPIQRRVVLDAAAVRPAESRSALQRSNLDRLPLHARAGAGADSAAGLQPESRIAIPRESSIPTGSTPAATASIESPAGPSSSGPPSSSETPWSSEAAVVSDAQWSVSVSPTLETPPSAPLEAEIWSSTTPQSVPAVDVASSVSRSVPLLLQRSLRSALDASPLGPSRTPLPGRSPATAGASGWTIASAYAPTSALAPASARASASVSPPAFVSRAASGDRVLSTFPSFSRNATADVQRAEDAFSPPPVVLSRSESTTPATPRRGAPVPAAAFAPSLSPSPAPPLALARPVAPVDARVAEFAQRLAVHEALSENAARLETASAVAPTVQRDSIAEDSITQAAAARPASASPEAPVPGLMTVGGTEAAGASNPEQMEKLAGSLYPSLIRRLRAELLLDRERRGVRIDGV